MRVAYSNAQTAHIRTFRDERGNKEVKPIKLTHSQELIQNSQDVESCVQIPRALGE